jgi:hypothetical protein
MPIFSVRYKYTFSLGSWNATETTFLSDWFALMSAHATACAVGKASRGQDLPLMHQRPAQR